MKIGVKETGAGQDPLHNIYFSVFSMNRTAPTSSPFYVVESCCNAMKLIISSVRGCYDPFPARGI
jgi:hypothetical protein